MRAWFRKAGYYLRRRRFDADLARELAQHVELEAEALERQGVAPAAARAEARRRVGRFGAIAEESRQAWQLGGMEGLLRDVRFTLRSLGRQPGATAIAVIALGLGIGATTTVFSILNGVLLRPLPYPDSGRLVAVWEHNLPRNQDHNIVNPGNYLAWRDRTRAADLAIFTWSGLTLLDGQPERFSGRAVSPNLFALLGVRPALGRGFETDDALAGAPRTVVLSDALWRRRFGADSAIVGRTVRARGDDVRVLGVMPRDFRPLDGEAFWEPYVMPPPDRAFRGRNSMVLGRLRPGVTLERAQADLAAAARRLEEEHPNFDTGFTVNVVRLKDDVVRGARPALVLLSVAIGLVLLIAAANVATLLLGRALTRRHELAIRSALGAGRRELLRQSLVEGTLLAALGGALGAVMALGLTRLLVASGLELIPRLQEIAVDLPALGFAALLTLGLGQLCGMIPAVALRDRDLHRTMVGSSPRSSGGTSAARAVLVVGQVAFSLVLLAGAGLLLRSLGRLVGVDPGFEPTRALSVDVSTPADRYPTAERRLRFQETVVDRIAVLPGVAAAGWVSDLPLTLLAPGTGFRATDRATPDDGQWPVADIRVADSGYFRAAGIRLVGGRAFTAADRAGAPPVVIVNETLARLMWPAGGALGRGLKIQWNEPDQEVTIVGVAQDVRQRTLADEPRPMVYYPLGQMDWPSLSLVVRSAGSDPAGLGPVVRRTLQALAPEVPIAEPQPLTERLSEDLAPRRYLMGTMVLLATIAVVLAAVGLYGVLTYMVRQRTREIAVRRALGQSERQVVLLVARRTAVLVGLGVGLGLVGALAATRALRSLLYGVSPGDPVTLAVGVMVLLAVAATAAVVPARRVARLDPVQALRAE